MANIIVKLQGQHSVSVVTASLKSDKRRSLAPFLAGLVEAIGPIPLANVQILNADSVAASGIITVLDNSKVAANDTFRVGALLLTAKASGASTNEFNIGASVTATAAAIAAAINAYGAGLVRASGAVGVVTVTCNVAGVTGNAIPILLTLADSDGASCDAALAGGLDDTASSVDYRSF